MKSLFEKFIIIGIFVLSCLALLALMWPLYRISLITLIGTNEGWNAFFADAAMGKMLLYPSLEKLITNNYPPLSFYIVGAFGALLGDNVLAGRLISLIGFFTILFFITKIIKKGGGSQQSILIGGLYFIIVMSSLFTWYIGFNDPQIMAQAIMISGFFLFLKAVEQHHGFCIAMVVMVLAGFCKHNIITLPLSALLWLVWQRRWREFLFCCGFSLLLILVGFIFCYQIYGMNFFYNLLTPRQFLLTKTHEIIMELRVVFLGMLIWFILSWKHRTEKFIQLINIMLMTGLVVGFTQRLGSGVFKNAEIDLIIGVAIAMGTAFELVGKRKFHEAMISRLGLIIYLCLPLSVAKPPVFRPLFSSAYQAKIARREQCVIACVEKVRATPGDVYCESYIAYRAGKPFVVDGFNVQERINAGKLPKDIIAQLIKEHKLTQIECEHVGLE